MDDVMEELRITKEELKLVKESVGFLTDTVELLSKSSGKTSVKKIKKLLKKGVNTSLQQKFDDLEAEYGAKLEEIQRENRAEKARMMLDFETFKQEMTEKMSLMNLTSKEETEELYKNNSGHEELLKAIGNLGNMLVEKVNEAKALTEERAQQLAQLFTENEVHQQDAMDSQIVENAVFKKEVREALGKIEKDVGKLKESHACVAELMMDRGVKCEEEKTKMELEIRSNGEQLRSIGKKIKNMEIAIIEKSETEESELNDIKEDEDTALETQAPMIQPEPIFACPRCNSVLSKKPREDGVSARCDKCVRSVVVGKLEEGNKWIYVEMPTDPMDWCHHFQQVPICIVDGAVVKCQICGNEAPCKDVSSSGMGKMVTETQVTEEKGNETCSNNGQSDNSLDWNTETLTGKGDKIQWNILEKRISKMVKNLSQNVSSKLY